MEGRFWLVLLGCAFLSGCGRPGEPEALLEELAVQPVSTLPGSPQDAKWGQIPVYRAPLLPQDVVEPRLMKPSVQLVEVQAATDTKRLAFRLYWRDATKDDRPGSDRFADACAVQMPVETRADVPDPQMGEKNKAVAITYWSAFLQATADGRPDAINAIYQGARVDHYPFEAAPLKENPDEQRKMALRYAPARALGNPMSGKHKQPVQDLIATGPGTLHPAPESVSSGHGVYTGQGWQVLLIRPLDDRLSSSTMGQVAFALWDGAKKEVGSRKMRSVWIPLSLQVKK